MTVSWLVARVASKIFSLLQIPWRPLVRLRVSGECRPWIRIGGSDLAVFKQVFVERHYARGAPAGPINTVVDCGANIGMATVWFAREYPQASVVAIEPDAGNFAVLSRNAREVRRGVRLIHAGIWSRPCRLALSRDRGAGEWASKTAESPAGEVPGITMADLVGQLGNPEIDILKVDIEGGECEMFQGDVSWLSRVRCLMIETHGPESEAVIARACSGILEPTLRNGEIAVWTRPG